MCERRIAIDSFVRIGPNTFARTRDSLAGGGSLSTIYRIDPDGNVYQAKIKTWIPGTTVYGRKVEPRTSGLRPNLKIGRQAAIQRTHPDMPSRHQIIYDSQIPSGDHPVIFVNAPDMSQSELDLGL